MGLMWEVVCVNWEYRDTWCGKLSESLARESRINVRVSGEAGLGCQDEWGGTVLRRGRHGEP